MDAIILTALYQVHMAQTVRGGFDAIQEIPQQSQIMLGVFQHLLGMRCPPAIKQMCDIGQ